MKSFRIGKVTIGGKRPAFILGPCVIESEKFVWRMAREIAKICGDEDVDLIFKASYDKANRTSVKSFRGIGPREGCEILRAIGDELKVPVTTDVHSPDQAKLAGDMIDLLQIPAFLCRQTDLLQAAAQTKRAVNVKKGQFLAPWDVKNIADKLKSFGCKNFCFTERGTSFGYNNLVADMRSLVWMRESGYPVIFDATHSVQRPGGGGDAGNVVPARRSPGPCGEKGPHPGSRSGTAGRRSRRRARGNAPRRRHPLADRSRSRALSLRPPSPAYPPRRRASGPRARGGGARPCDAGRRAPRRASRHGRMFSRLKVALELWSAAAM